ncbi:MAG: hypothetical protein Q9162_006710 [Coniocarpon cinnabarinum]
MGREEQREERDVLESIFPGEISDISETEWRVTIRLELPDGVIPSAEEDNDDTQLTVMLRVSLPEKYPESAPDLDLALPPNAPRIPHLDISSDKALLLQDLDPTVEENLGMAMIFTLVSTLKESIENLITDRAQRGEREREEEMLKAEEEENRKFEGEKVTAERFLAWREAFRKEMQEAEDKRKEAERAETVKRLGAKAVRDEEKKLTGKELWLRGLAGKGEDEDDDDDVDGLSQSMDKTDVK